MRALDDAIQQILWGMLKVRERVVELARKLFPDDVIYVEAMNSFKFASGVTQGGGPGAPTSNSSS